MNVEFRNSFIHDLKRIKDESLATQVKDLIALVEQVDTFREIGNVKKLTGGDRYYRIRVGDYRGGIDFGRQYCRLCSLFTP